MNIFPPNPWFDRLRYLAPSQRSAAVMELLTRDHADALPLLIEALRHEPEVLVREDITYALVRVGAAAVEPMIALLGDEDAASRHHAAHVLGKISDPRAVEALITALADDHAAVVLKAAFALSQIGDTRALPALMRQLGHENREVETMLISVLERFGAAAIPGLMQALAEGRWQVREQAADALGGIGDQAALPALVQALQDTQWQVRFAAANALGTLGGSAAWDALETLQNDPEPRVQSLAARLLPHRR